jgi:hypothetical protein
VTEPDLPDVRLLRRRRQSALRPLWITSEMKSNNATAKTRSTSLSTNNALFMDFALAIWRGMRNKTLAKAFCQFRWLLPAT